MRQLIAQHLNLKCIYAVYRCYIIYMSSVSLCFTSLVRGKYFSGDMDFGAMMEAATVLGALQGAFTTLVTQMGAVPAAF